MDNDRATPLERQPNVSEPSELGARTIIQHPHNPTKEARAPGDVLKGAERITGADLPQVEVKERKQTDKQTVAPRRLVFYRPTPEDEGHGFDAGADFVALIVKVNADGTANLHVFSPTSSSTILKQDVVQGADPGQFRF